jgi:PAS domain S-box-containing protein
MPATPTDFAAMAELLPDLAWIANPRGRIVLGNQRRRDYTGATPETIGDMDWSKIHDPEFLPRVQEMEVQSQVSGDSAEMAFPLRGADGQYRMFLTRPHPIRNASGEITHRLCVNIDVRVACSDRCAVRAEADAGSAQPQGCEHRR